ncbi:MAG: VCBS repeat-containing protein [Candidatus Sumerlaeia bacterium]|nr:VCBS repeat-containing protein [Candidatus Sumerlaeia bacterium]
MTKQATLYIAAITALAFGAVTVGNSAESIKWETVVLDRGMSEGCSVFDVNGDGLLDVVCLPSWYRAPFWDKRPVHDIMKTGEFLMNYGQIPMDVNGDGAIDVVSAGWFDKDIFWYENPFTKNKVIRTINDEYTTWAKHVLPTPPQLGGGCECILGLDVDGDGNLDVVPNRRPLGWYERVNGQFVRHPVDESGRKAAKWLHGLGQGDINGDGRPDLVTGEGWWEAPKNPRTEKWIEHREFEFPDGSIPILVVDFDGDGDNDLIYGEGHTYGLYWVEQARDSGGRKWVKHDIDTTRTQPRCDIPTVPISQAHSLVWIDLDGDGQNELVTGKRWRGHGDDDPGSFDPLCVYYYKWDRPTKTWTKHVISYDEHIGVGMQVQVVDIDKDGDLDVICPGKSGLYIMKNLTVNNPVKYPETIYRMRKPTDKPAAAGAKKGAGKGKKAVEKK